MYLDPCLLRKYAFKVTWQPRESSCPGQPNRNFFQALGHSLYATMIHNEHFFLHGCSCECARWSEACVLIGYPSRPHGPCVLPTWYLLLQSRQKKVLLTIQKIFHWPWLFGKNGWIVAFVFFSIFITKNCDLSWSKNPAFFCTIKAFFHTMT